MTESVVCSIPTVLLHFHNIIFFSFISSFTCLCNFSTPSSFVSVLQNSKSLLSWKQSEHICTSFRAQMNTPSLLRMDDGQGLCKELINLYFVHKGVLFISLSCSNLENLHESSFKYKPILQKLFLSRGVCTSSTSTLIDWVYCEKFRYASLDKHLWIIFWIKNTDYLHSKHYRIP